MLHIIDATFRNKVDPLNLHFRRAIRSNGNMIFSSSLVCMIKFIIAFQELWFFLIFFSLFLTPSNDELLTDLSTFDISKNYFASYNFISNKSLFYYKSFTAEFLRNSRKFLKPYSSIFVSPALVSKCPLDKKF